METEMLIDEKQLKENSAEILREYADISHKEALELITQYEIDCIVERMLDAQAEQVSYISERYKNGELDGI